MSGSDVVDVVRGIPAGARVDVAQLYWEAFGRKLSPSLGDRERGVRYLELQLNADSIFCAVDSGRVVGVLGFHDETRGAVGFSYRRLAQQYSAISAPWRAVLLGILGRVPRKEELLLDGLSVAPEVRGRGVGSQLLEHAIAFAEQRGLNSIRLSVIDSNPRARALYERLGFVAGETVSMGLLGDVFGFRKSTDMVFRLPRGGEA